MKRSLPPVPVSVRAKIRASALFVCLVTPTWFHDSTAQAQVAYARTLGKPFRLLVRAGTRVPEDCLLGVEDVQVVVFQSTTEAAAQLQAWLREAWLGSSHDGAGGLGGGQD